MLPAIPLAMRIGAPIAMALLLAGGWYLYKESLRSEGRQQVEAAHAKEVQAQQEDVREVELQQHKDKLAAVERAAAQKAWLHAQLLQSDAKKSREIHKKDQEIHRLNEYVEAVQNQRPDHEVRYVEVEKIVERPVETPCLVPDVITRRVDELASMLNTLPYHRVPGAGGAPAELEVHSAGPATCAQLITRLEVLTSRYGNAMIDHLELDDYIMRQVELNREFRQRHAE